MHVWRRARLNVSPNDVHAHEAESAPHRGVMLSVWITGGAMVFSAVFWALALHHTSGTLASPSPSVIALAHGKTINVNDLPDGGRRNVLAIAQRVHDEHTSATIQASGARDLVNAWALRNHIAISKVDVVIARGDSICSVSITQGADQNRGMMAHASDPINSCRALIASMEARYPELKVPSPLPLADDGALGSARP